MHGHCVPGDRQPRFLKVRQRISKAVESIFIRDDRSSGVVVAGIAPDTRESTEPDSMGTYVEQARLLGRLVFKCAPTIGTEAPEDKGIQLRHISPLVVVGDMRIQLGDAFALQLIWAEYKQRPAVDVESLKLAGNNRGQVNQDSSIASCPGGGLK